MEEIQSIHQGLSMFVQPGSWYAVEVENYIADAAKGRDSRASQCVHY